MEEIIKRLIIDNQQDVKRLMLSQSAIYLFNYCKSEKGVMSHQVADRFLISIQSSSLRLKKLFDLGYLTRTEITSETGGIEFIYYVWE